MANRKLFFRLEKLDSNERVIERKEVIMTTGRIDVNIQLRKRKAMFSLLEALPEDWQRRRWKLYYGYTENGALTPVYFPLGVFLPINPNEVESQNGFITNMQGVDKTSLFSNFELDEPVTFDSGTPVRSIVQTIAGWVGETKMLLDTNLGTLGADFTFEEGTTAESLLTTLLSSFSKEWYYNADGFLVATAQIDPHDKPTRFVLDDIADPKYITAERNIDTTNYYNSVTVQGGTIDTPIYRASIQNDDAIEAAGGQIVKRYFTVDAAITQDQVDARAAFYLSGGVQLPSTIRVTSLVIPNIEVGDIVEKGGKRYQVRTFDVPLSVAVQTIEAGEIL